jgi:hypothetical protein
MLLDSQNSKPHAGIDGTDAHDSVPVGQSSNGNVAQHDGNQASSREEQTDSDSLAARLLSMQVSSSETLDKTMELVRQRQDKLIEEGKEASAAVLQALRDRIRMLPSVEETKVEQPLGPTAKSDAADASLGGADALPEISEAKTLYPVWTRIAKRYPFESPQGLPLAEPELLQALFDRAWARYKTVKAETYPGKREDPLRRLAFDEEHFQSIRSSLQRSPPSVRGDDHRANSLFHALVQVLQEDMKRCHIVSSSSTAYRKYTWGSPVPIGAQGEPRAFSRAESRNLNRTLALLQTQLRFIWVRLQKAKKANGDTGPSNAEGARGDTRHIRTSQESTQADGQDVPTEVEPSLQDGNGHAAVGGTRTDSQQDVQKFAESAKGGVLVVVNDGSFTLEPASDDSPIVPPDQGAGTIKAVEQKLDDNSSEGRSSKIDGDVQCSNTSRGELNGSSVKVDGEPRRW